MNTQPIQKPTSVRWSAVWLACLMLSGCELDRPNFQMNSNSPTPFFGFDLLPRRRTTSLVKPRPNENSAVAQIGSSEVSPVEGGPRVGRFLKQNMKWNDQTERTIILPLTKTDPDQPIDRGPVELFP